MRNQRQVFQDSFCIQALLVWESSAMLLRSSSCSRAAGAWDRSSKKCVVVSRTMVLSCYICLVAEYMRTKVLAWQRDFLARYAMKLWWKCTTWKHSSECNGCNFNSSTTAILIHCCCKPLMHTHKKIPLLSLLLFFLHIIFFLASKMGQYNI